MAAWRCSSRTRSPQTAWPCVSAFIAVPVSNAGAAGRRAGAPAPTARAGAPLAAAGASCAMPAGVRRAARRLAAPAVETSTAVDAETCGHAVCGDRVGEEHLQAAIRARPGQYREALAAAAAPACAACTELSCRRQMRCGRGLGPACAGPLGGTGGGAGTGASTLGACGGARSAGACQRPPRTCLSLLRKPLAPHAGGAAPGDGRGVRRLRSLRAPSLGATSAQPSPLGRVAELLAGAGAAARHAGAPAPRAPAARGRAAARCLRWAQRAFLCGGAVAASSLASYASGLGRAACTRGQRPI
jgi:hypothetical protein